VKQPGKRTPKGGGKRSNEKKIGTDETGGGGFTTVSNINSWGAANWDKVPEQWGGHRGALLGGLVVDRVKLPFIT